MKEVLFVVLSPFILGLIVILVWMGLDELDVRLSLRRSRKAFVKQMRIADPTYTWKKNRWI